MQASYIEMAEFHSDLYLRELFNQSNTDRSMPIMPTEDFGLVDDCLSFPGNVISRSVCSSAF